MFIKLSRLDGTPIWLNGGFVVTVEPRKGGGSTVVPIGDGLDYDVREAPEAVLAMLDGVPPSPVAVPAPKSLTATPEDVSPVGEPGVVTEVSVAAAPDASASPDVAEKGTRKGSRRAPRKVAKAPARPAEPPSPAADVVPPDVEAVDAPVTNENAPVMSAPPQDALDVFARPGDRGLSAEQVDRLRKMAPGSLRKLQNTLVSQFRVTDADGAVAALAAQGALTIDHDRVIWGSPA